MSTAAASLTRDPFMPRRPQGMRAGLLLAILAHALLIVGLAYSVDWHSSTEPAAVEAELWSAVPQQAAPRAAAPAAPTAPSPPVVRRAEPPSPVKPQPPAAADPQIAIEKAREARQAQTDREIAEQEQARRDKARRDRARQDELDRQQAERAQQSKEQQARDDQARRKLSADKLAKAEKEKVDKEKAEKDKADRTAAAAARDANLKRIQGMAGASGDSNSTGTAPKSSGPSSSYAGRIMARIKPNIVFSDPVAGNPTASVEVRVAPDGTITSRRLVQSSGVKAWDDAVLRAIDRTDGLPRDIDGRVQPVMLIDFKPQ